MTSGKNQVMGQFGQQYEQRVDGVRRRVTRLPRSKRRIILAVIGGVLFIAAALIVPIPGPFSIVLFVLGLTVLSWEFEFAKKMRNGVKTTMNRFRSNLGRRNGRRG